MLHLLTAPTFGAKHIIGLLFVLFIVIIGVILLKNKTTKKEILLITVLFYIFEILKIGYMIYRSGSYPMNHLPLHLCSMPLYVWVVLYVSKEGSKLEEFALATAFVTVLGAGLAALIQPGNIIGNELSWSLVEDNFLPFISFVYHALMIMSAVYLLASKKYKPRYTDAFRSMAFTFILMIPALIVNLTLDKDYMLLYKGNGSPFKGLFATVPSVEYTLFMIFIGLFIMAFISVITATIYKLTTKRGA